MFWYVPVPCLLQLCGILDDFQRNIFPIFFFLSQYASPLNTEMTVNVSEHFIRDEAAGLSEGSLWSAIKSENQLVGFSV